MLVGAVGSISTSVFLFLGTPACVHKVVMWLGNNNKVFSCFAQVSISEAMIAPRFNSHLSIMQPTSTCLLCRSIDSFCECTKLLLMNLNQNHACILISFFLMIYPSSYHEGAGISTNEANHFLVSSNILSSTISFRELRF